MQNLAKEKEEMLEKTNVYRLRVSGYKELSSQLVLLFLTKRNTNHMVKTLFPN